MANSSQVQKLANIAKNSTTLLQTTTRRKYATHADLPQIRPAPKTTSNPFVTSVIATTYKWPEIQPANFVSFSSQHLDLPLRRDLLHRAVVFEADSKRAGLASTKHRSNMRGSSRKLRPQKGTGRARLSDRKSPMLKGGGVAHGPHPRDFSTGLPEKIYNLAVRTALSYRYRKGELFIIKNQINTKDPEQGPRWVHNIFTENGWGKGNGRTMVVTRTDRGTTDLVKEVGEHASIRNAEDVDVKDLLSCGRVMIELEALRSILQWSSKGLEHLIKPGSAITSTTEGVSI